MSIKTSIYPFLSSSLPQKKNPIGTLFSIIKYTIVFPKHRYNSFVKFWFYKISKGMKKLYRDNPKKQNSVLGLHTVLWTGM